MLRRLHRLTSPDARIAAESRDVYSTDDPDHLAYHERNRRRGRMAGQLRLRVRHRTAMTPWFGYLIVSPHELRELVAGSGWQLNRLIEGEGRHVRRRHRQDLNPAHFRSSDSHCEGTVTTGGCA